MRGFPLGKVKGTILVKVIKSLRSQREQAKKVLPEKLHHYLDERVLATAWFEEEDYLELMRALSKLLPDPGIPVWEFMGRESAREDFEDLYKSLVRENDPAATLKGFETLWDLRHDTGQVEIILEGPGKARIDLTDYALVSREICQSIQGHLWGTLHRGGAEEIELRKALCRARGDDQCRWEARWRDPQSPGP